MRWARKAIILGVGMALIAACSERETEPTDRRDVMENDVGRDITGTDTAPSDAQIDPGPGGLTIYDIQDASRPGHPGADSTVTVAGVITAIDSAPRGDDPETFGDFWIQDPAGGAFSGVAVFNLGGRAYDHTTLEVGQTVQVTGIYEEFYGLSVIQLSLLNVIDATPRPLTPQTVNPAEVATGRDQAEAFEGVLVQVENVTVTDNAVGFGQFRITGDLLIDDELTNVSPFPPTGTEYERIVGVLTFAHDEVTLNPRSPDDLVGDVEVPILTISDIQDTTSENHPAEDSTVTVPGVITAIDTRLRGDGDPNSKDNFWIQEREGGPFSGIFCFTFGGQNFDTAAQVGQTVEVTAEYEERYGLSQLVLESMTIVDETVSPLTPQTVDPADVATGGSMAEAFEGVLVEVLNVEVTETNPENLGQYSEFAVTGGLEIEEELTPLTPIPAVGTRFDRIAGVLHFDFDTVRLYPRSADDIVESSE